MFNIWVRRQRGIYQNNIIYLDADASLACVALLIIRDSLKAQAL